MLTRRKSRKISVTVARHYDHDAKRDVLRDVANCLWADPPRTKRIEEEWFLRLQQLSTMIFHGEAPNA